MATTAVAVLAAAVAVTRLSLSIHTVAPTCRKRPAIFEIPVWLGWLVWLSNPYGNYGSGSFGGGGGSYGIHSMAPTFRKRPAIFEITLLAFAPSVFQTMACDLPDFPKTLTGVLDGTQTAELFKFAQKKGFAIPAVNCTSSSTINCVLEAARDTHNPVVIQVSQGGGAFYCGKGIKDTNLVASVAGAVALAHHIRVVAPMYGIPVVIHSDHCAKKLLPWFDGMLDADEAYFKEKGVPLFSSHMLDLSEEMDEENIETCVKYFKRMVCGFGRCIALCSCHMRDVPYPCL